MKFRFFVIKERFKYLQIKYSYKQNGAIEFFRSDKRARNGRFPWNFNMIEYAFIMNSLDILMKEEKTATTKATKRVN